MNSIVVTITDGVLRIVRNPEYPLPDSAEILARIAQQEDL